MILQPQAPAPAAPPPGQLTALSSPPRPRVGPTKPPPGAGRRFHSLHFLRNAALRPFLAPLCCAPHFLRLLCFGRCGPSSAVPPLSPPHRYLSHQSPSRTLPNACPPHRSRAAQGQKKAPRRPLAPPNQAAGRRPKKARHPPVELAFKPRRQKQGPLRGGSVGEHPKPPPSCPGLPPGHPPRPPQPPDGRPLHPHKAGSAE